MPVTKDYAENLYSEVKDVSEKLIDEGKVNEDYIDFDEEHENLNDFLSGIFNISEDVAEFYYNETGELFFEERMNDFADIQEELEIGNNMKKQYYFQLGNLYNMVAEKEGVSVSSFSPKVIAETKSDVRDKVEDLLTGLNDELEESGLQYL
ncbi:MAG: hypothetical protein ABEI78_00790 [Candidatus Nanohaloarchaea archaeon]